MIKLLIVDDSSFMRKVIAQMVARDPEISVVATAGDGREALEKIRDLKPDVVTMDIIMPLPDGLWALEEIMRQNPTPVVILSSVAGAQSEIVEEAYALGVVDVVQKPQNPEAMHGLAVELITKIKAAAKIEKSRLLARLLPASPVPLARGIKQKALSVLVIGSSAGGPIGLDEVLPKIPKDFQPGIIVAQHMPQQFLTSYIEHLGKRCCFPIQIARDGDLVTQKRILFSPGDATLVIARTKKGAVVKIVKPDVRIQPDIDMVYASCAEVFKEKTICVVLSGMGRYGVTGARSIKEAGGKIIAEDKSTAPVYGMPEAVFSERLTDCVMPSHQITEAVLNLLAGRNPCDVKKESLMVKGVLLRAFTQYLQENFGEKSLELVTENMPAQSQAVVRAGFAAHILYSGSLYREFYQKAIELLGQKNPHMLEEIGAVEARTVIALYRQSLFAKAESIEHFVGILPKLLAAVFYGVTGEIAELDVPARRVTMVLRDHTADKDIAVKISRERAAGWVRALAKDLVNITTARARWETGSDEKGFFVKINVAW